MIKTIINNKKLKKYSALELVPVALVSFEVDQNEIVILQVPRFRQVWLQNLFLGKLKSPFFRVKLDIIGSHVWQLINGQRNNDEIISEFTSSQHINNKAFDDADKRVLAFITDLYRKDLITFKQIV